VITFADDAVSLAEGLAGRGVPATADVRSTGGKACVLVAPPAVDFTTKTTTWTLVALAGRSAADLDTFRKRADLVALVVAATSIESARPGFYQLTSDQPPVPAYLMTLTGGIGANR
jgi:hypothetical protein